MWTILLCIQPWHSSLCHYSCSRLSMIPSSIAWDFWDGPGSEEEDLNLRRILASFLTLSSSSRVLRSFSLTMYSNWSNPSVKSSVWREKLLRRELSSAEWNNNMLAIFDRPALQVRLKNPCKLLLPFGDSSSRLTFESCPELVATSAIFHEKFIRNRSKIIYWSS